MKQNFKESVSEEVDYFIQKFIDAGWEIEDENYLVKNVDFETHPDAANEYWKNKVSLSFEPKLLEYYNRAEKSYAFLLYDEGSKKI